MEKTVFFCVDNGLSPLPFGCQAKTLRKRDHSHITALLNSLKNEELFRVGIMLGLSYANLQGISDDTLLDGIIRAWLRKEDDVLGVSGDPTWENLSRTLRELGHTTIASGIDEGKFICPVNFECA